MAPQIRAWWVCSVLVVKAMFIPDHRTTKPSPHQSSSKTFKFCPCCSWSPSRPSRTFFAFAFFLLLAEAVQTHPSDHRFTAVKAREFHSPGASVPQHRLHQLPAEPAPAIGTSKSSNLVIMPTISTMSNHGHHTLPIMELYGTECYSWSRLTRNYATVSSGFCSPGSHATNFFDTNNRNLTWNPTEAETDPKLHNEKTNMKFEQVIQKSMWEFFRLMWSSTTGTPWIFWSISMSMSGE